MSKINLTREELYQQVWLEPMTLLANRYKVKYEELRKICRNQNIPIPKSGHWMKLKYGKSSEIEPLPPAQVDIKEIAIDKPVIIAIDKEPSPLESLQKEIENDTIISLVVPNKLSNPDILITQAKETFLNPGDYQTGYKSPSGFYRWEVLRIDVTKENLGRALRFMDTLIKALRGRGHQITTGRQTSLTIYNETITVNFREKNKRTVVQRERYGNTTALKPTGILTFNIEGLYPKEWKDGKKMLEEQLSKIIAFLELEGKRLQERTERWRIHREEKAEKERIESEKQELIEKERQDFENLLESARKYHDALILREYVKTIEKKALLAGELNINVKEWILWANKKADQNDPTMDLDETLSNHVNTKVSEF